MGKFLIGVLFGIMISDIAVQKIPSLQKLKIQSLSGWPLKTDQERIAEHYRRYGRKTLYYS